MSIVFCPYCGQALQRTSSELYCENGDMFISYELEKLLKEYIERGEFRETGSEMANGKLFHCPKCGGPAQNEDGHVHCGVCHRTLNGFMYPLLKAHIHR